MHSIVLSTDWHEALAAKCRLANELAKLAIQAAEMIDDRTASHEAQLAEVSVQMDAVASLWPGPEMWPLERLQGLYSEIEAMSLALRSEPEDAAAIEGVLDLLGMAIAQELVSPTLHMADCLQSYAQAKSLRAETEAHLPQR